MTDEDVVSFDLDVEVYLKDRQDSILTMLEIQIPIDYWEEVGMEGLMEHCLDDLLAQTSHRESRYVVLRNTKGMRQVYWEDAIQAIFLHVPSYEMIQRLVEEATQS